MNSFKINPGPCARRMARQRRCSEDEPVFRVESNSQDVWGAVFDDVLRSSEISPDGRAVPGWTRAATRLHPAPPSNQRSHSSLAVSVGTCQCGCVPSRVQLYGCTSCVHLSTELCVLRAEVAALEALLERVSHLLCASERSEARQYSVLCGLVSLLGVERARRQESRM